MHSYFLLQNINNVVDLKFGHFGKFRTIVTLTLERGGYWYCRVSLIDLYSPTKFE